MTSIKIELDRAILGQVPGKLSNFSTVLDKFVQRAATEAGRTMARNDVFRQQHRANHRVRVWNIETINPTYVV